MNNARLGLALGATLASALPGAVSAASPAEEAALRAAFDGVAISDAAMAEERGGTAGRGVIASSSGVVVTIGVMANTYSGSGVVVVGNDSVVVGTVSTPASAPAPPIVVSQHHMPRYDAPIQTHGLGGGAPRPGR